MHSEPVVAVVGATGAVGREILDILEERNFPASRVEAIASARSEGKQIPFRGGELVVEALENASFSDVDLVLSSAGSSVSEKFVPRAVDEGAVVVDNTSAFRMDDDTPLVVPEVNPEKIAKHSGVIANPNCSTIQMVVALEPLRQLGNLERLVISTYQSASGAGQSGVEELMESVEAYLESDEKFEPETFSAPLAFDALAHIGPFFDNGYTKEEEKMLYETRKIMRLPELQASATCIRIPVVRAHSESITVDFDRPVMTRELKRVLEDAQGVNLKDEPETDAYPRSREVAETDEVWVGRVRQDNVRDNTAHLWVVSDNLRKGAALNTVQIAELLLE